MWEDPIVAEVHRAREKLAAQCNYDIAEFFAELRRHQATAITPLVPQKKRAELASSAKTTDEDGTR